MKIIITETQVALIRRLSELEHYLDIAIKELNEYIKSGSPGNKPNNFGVYERWVINKVEIESLKYLQPYKHSFCF